MHGQNNYIYVKCLFGHHVYMYFSYTLGIKLLQKQTAAAHAQNKHITVIVVADMKPIINKQQRRRIVSSAGILFGMQQVLQCTTHQQIPIIILASSNYFLVWNIFNKPECS